MNAIKLPVKAYASHGDSWRVIDSTGSRIGDYFNEEHAHQIATALNSRDAMVDALKFYAKLPSECRNRVTANTTGTKTDWIAEIGLDEGDIARAALAKVEDLRKTT